jgi:hypothetical protein
MPAKKPAPRNQTLTMNRGGEFKIWASGENHCGVVNDLNIKYTMICECDTRLDGRGFLFDQINVDNFFKGIGESTLSCEMLCIDCADQLMALIKKENPGCVVRRMALTLSPQPFLASMTYEWQADKKKPARKPFIDFKM